MLVLRATTEKLESKVCSYLKNGTKAFTKKTGKLVLSLLMLVTVCVCFGRRVIVSIFYEWGMACCVVSKERCAGSLGGFCRRRAFAFR